jgi:nucleoside-triphosphatase
VHLQEFESLVLRQIDAEMTPADLYIIDEIGKMELFSERFRNKLMELLSRPSNLLATIAKKGDSFLDKIKQRDEIELTEVTKQNRDRLPQEITDRILVEISRIR